MTIVTRRGFTGDRPALLDLWVESWQAAMPQLDFEARRAWLSGHLDALATGGSVLLVASDRERPVGFVTVDNDGLVDQLAVAVRHQGQGVGRLLIAAARAHADGGLRLSVNTGNARAIAFYERQGFAAVGHGTNPHSGLPVLHMAG